MDTMLILDIYGLKVRINFASGADKDEIADLLRLFIAEEEGDTDVSLDFKKKVARQEIAGCLFPFLAEREIWAMHSGGFHYNGGYLTVGPSSCGKSTFSYMAMKNGLTLLSDDITLVRDVPSGVEILPFYSAIYLKYEVIFPDLGLFKPAVLKSVLLPRFGGGALRVSKVERRIELLRHLTSQFLWSYEGKEQEKQRRLVEKMCDYPAFEVYWNDTMFDDYRLFGGILDEIV